MGLHCKWTRWTKGRKRNRNGEVKQLAQVCTGCSVTAVIPSPINSLCCLLRQQWPQYTGVHKQQTGKPNNSADVVLSFQSNFGTVHVCGRCSEGGSTALQPQFYLCSSLIWTFYSIKRWILIKHTSFIIKHYYYFIGIVPRVLRALVWKNIRSPLTCCRLPKGF